MMFETWLKLATAGMDMALAGVRTGEAMIAADSVIRNRSETVAHALRDPLSADYAELSRLVPEKLGAIGQAASAVSMESIGIWVDALSLYQTMWKTSRAGVEDLGKATGLMARMGSLYGLALDPFHAKVTANARRLEKGRGSRKGVSRRSSPSGGNRRRSR
jgi:hypothetical protein